MPLVEKTVTGGHGSNCLIETSKLLLNEEHKCDISIRSQLMSALPQLGLTEYLCSDDHQDPIIRLLGHNPKDYTIIVLQTPAHCERRKAGPDDPIDLHIVSKIFFTGNGPITLFMLNYEGRHFNPLVHPKGEVFRTIDIIPGYEEPSTPLVELVDESQELNEGLVY